MYIGLDFYCLWYPYRLWIDGLYAIDRIYHADLASAQKIDHEIDGEVFCVFFVGVVGDESGDEYYMYLRGTFCYQSLIGILLARLSIGSSAIKKQFGKPLYFESMRHIHVCSEGKSLCLMLKSPLWVG